MQGPGDVAPLVWMSALDVIPHSPQIVATEFSIHGLSWWNRFLVHKAFYVKKTNQHSVDIAPNFSCFFGHEIGVFHRDDCCVVSVMHKHPRFVTSNDSGDKVGRCFRSVP